MIKINQERLINLFCDMVSIDSESGNEERFARYLSSLAKKIGYRSRVDGHGNVYISVDGNGKPLMLNTHMDTVSPGVGIVPIVKNGVIRSVGDTILGADPKVTIAAIFEILSQFKSGNFKYRPLEITFTCNEESGIPTADKIKSKAKECVVPDRGTPLGEIIVESPYAQVFEVAVKGKASYATTDFEKGKHAILSAAESIGNLPLGNFDRYSTSNIGLIHGGTATTVVPEKCTFKGNCYSFRQESLDYFLRKLSGQLTKSDAKYKTKSKVSMLEYFGGFEISKSDSLVEVVKEAMKNSGIMSTFKKYKAVSNANILNSIGIKTILISNGVRDQHTVNEHIFVDDLVKLAEIIINISLTIN